MAYRHLRRSQQASFLEQDTERQKEGVPLLVSKTLCQWQALTPESSGLLENVTVSLEQHFMVSFNLKLMEMRKTRKSRRSIIVEQDPSKPFAKREALVHFAVGGQRDSWMPRIVAVFDKEGRPPMLHAYVRQGAHRLRLKCPERVKYDDKEKTRVVFAVSGVAHDRFWFQVGSQKTMACAKGFAMPSPATLFVYLGGPLDPPVHDAQIYELEYHWQQTDADRLKSKNEKTRRTKEQLELPAEEEKVLIRASAEIEFNNRWRRFDTFFGLFVLINAAAMGAEVEFSNNPDGMAVISQIYRVLTGVFILELVLRLYRNMTDDRSRPLCSGAAFKELVKTFVNDHWIKLDFLVVISSILELVFTVSSPSVPGIYTLTRILRLFKLLKIVRLTRSFRGLGQLVEGIMQSLPTVLWAIVLMAILIYVASILFIRLQGLAPDDLPPAALDSLSDWTQMGTSAFILTVMTTRDGWSWYILSLLKVPGWLGPCMAALLLVVAAFLALGMMNLIVGLLCNTAFQLEMMDSRLRGAQLLMDQKKALTDLRHRLASYGQHLFKNTAFIELVDFDEAITSDAEVLEALHVLHLSYDELVYLANAFQESGNVEIDGLIEAIGIIELQRYTGNNLADSLQKTAKGAVLRPVDLLFFTYTNRQVEQILSEVELAGNNVASFALDTLSCLYMRADSAGTLLRTAAGPWHPPGTKPEQKHMRIEVWKLAESAKQHNLDAEEFKLYSVIDITFGFFVTINGIFIGFQTSAKGAETTIDGYWAIDATLTLLFVLEYYLRCRLHANICIVHEDVTNEDKERPMTVFEKAARTVELFQKVKQSVRYYVVAPLPPGGHAKVAISAFRMLLHASTAFDAAIVIFSVVDVLIMTPISDYTTASWSRSGLSALRLFRLFRIFKLMRIFKLFPKLFVLVSSLLGTWKQVLWIFALMFLILYAAAITLVQLIGDQSAPGNFVESYFSTIPRAMLTGWQMATLSGWSTVVEKTRRLGTAGIACTVVLLMLVIVLALGLMNMVVGVLCEVAITIARKDDMDKQREEFIELLNAMKGLQKFLEDEIHCDVLPKEFLEQALNIRLRPQMGELKDDPHVLGLARPGHHLSPQAMEKGRSKAFQQTLRKFFQDGNLPKDLVKQLYDKVDSARLGFITVDDLTKAAIVIKEDLAKVELYACTSALRDLRKEVASLGQNVLAIHELLQTVLKLGHLLIHRQKYTNSQERRSTPEDLGSLLPEVEKALEEMIKWEGVGTLPETLATGQFLVLPGNGLICVQGEEVLAAKAPGDDGEVLAAKAPAMNFKTDLRMGDFVLIEPSEMSQPDGHQRQTSRRAVLLQVTQIEEHKLKIARGAQVTLPPEMKFSILRSMESDVIGQETVVDDYRTMEVEGPKTLSPRSSQRLFEWNFLTRRASAKTSWDMEEDNKRLRGIEKALGAEFSGLKERPTMQKAFQGWKNLMKPKTRVRALVW